MRKIREATRCIYRPRVAGPFLSWVVLFACLPVIFTSSSCRRRGWRGTSSCQVGLAEEVLLGVAGHMRRRLGPIAARGGVRGADLPGIWGPVI